MNNYPPPLPSGQPHPSVIPPGSYPASDDNVYPQQQGYRPQDGPPVPPQKSGSKKVLLIVLGVVGGLCFLGIIGAAFGANKTTAAPAKYVVVLGRAGSGTKRSVSQVVTLSGKARMNYDYSGDGQFAPILVKEGDIRPIFGGPPESTCTSSCKGTTQLTQKGNYYLEVWVYLGNWAVTIEDLR